ncbi:ribonuclease P/MRP protein subunit POP5 [Nematocida displodere]|uniref:Ribonuclease P/MRP protein subunit POP5 n=1 Tax=Nematocida displodere TaxID=1805483 RepID=A0A177EE99_9MICR|nr:ribonuclease P/MRP protein subunit POP5 [Nematocida displodere]
MVREKFRYVVFRLECLDNEAPVSRSVSEKELFFQLKDQAARVLGDWEYAESVPKMKLALFYPVTGIGVVKVPSSGKEAFYRVLQSISAVGGRQCKLSPLKASGIIKKAKRWIVRSLK